MRLNFKSVEELENDYWEEPEEFPTDLVKRCYEYRKVPLDQLTTEQIRTLISQGIGIKSLIGLAVEQLKQDVLKEGDFYPGDLLEVVSRIPFGYWYNYPSERLTLKGIVESSSELITNELGEKKFNQINESIR